MPHSGPANGFDQVIVVQGYGLDMARSIMCNLNKTEIAPVSVSDTVIECPMCLPTKDPLETGSVDFGINFDHKFESFG